MCDELENNGRLQDSNSSRLIIVVSNIRLFSKLAQKTKLYIVLHAQQDRALHILVSASVRALYIDIKDTNMEQRERKCISTTGNYRRSHLRSSRVTGNFHYSVYSSEAGVGAMPQESWEI